MSRFFVFLPGGSGARSLPTVYACDCPKVSSLNFQAFYSIIWTLKAFSPNYAATNRKYTSECAEGSARTGILKLGTLLSRLLISPAHSQQSAVSQSSRWANRGQSSKSPFLSWPQSVPRSLRSRWVHGDIQTSSPLLRRQSGWILGTLGNGGF